MRVTLSPTAPAVLSRPPNHGRVNREHSRGLNRTHSVRHANLPGQRAGGHGCGDLRGRVHRIRRLNTAEPDARRAPKARARHRDLGANSPRAGAEPSRCRRHRLGHDERRGRLRRPGGGRHPNLAGHRATGHGRGDLSRRVHGKARLLARKLDAVGARKSGTRHHDRGADCSTCRTKRRHLRPCHHRRRRHPQPQRTGHNHSQDGRDRCSSSDRHPAPLARFIDRQTGGYDLKLRGAILITRCLYGRE